MCVPHLTFIPIQIIHFVKGVIIHATPVAAILLRVVIVAIQIQTDLSSIIPALA